jgi:hypothetical protein
MRRLGFAFTVFSERNFFSLGAGLNSAIMAAPEKLTFRNSILDMDLRDSS